MDVKSGVFISHIAEEKTVACELKDFLREAFGTQLKVFLSSDYESIGSGDEWFGAILRALKSAQFVLVLLSEVSVDRRWINLEAGVGLGADARVIPVVFRGLTKDRIGLPLSQLQARSLWDPGDVQAIVQDIEGTCQRASQPTDPDRFVSKVLHLEKTLPFGEIRVTPSIREFGDNYLLEFDLKYTGNRNVELVKVEVKVPKRYVSPIFMPPIVPGILDRASEELEGERYDVLTYRVFEGPTPGGIRGLPRYLTPGTPPERLDLNVLLRQNLKEADRVDLPIFHAVYAKSMQPVKGQSTYRKLVMNKFTAPLRK